MELAKKKFILFKEEKSRVQMRAPHIKNAYFLILIGKAILSDSRERHWHGQCLPFRENSYSLCTVLMGLLHENRRGTMI